jgi:hypothetical protein
VHTEEQKIAYVLAICQRIEREFTLREIIARVTTERPEMIMEFAELWGSLIRDKLVVISRNGEPNTYRLTKKPEGMSILLDEAPFRAQLQSPDGLAYGHSILDTVAAETVVNIRMSDGSILRLSDVSDSLNALREIFGWKAR